ncbi:hypothetical protein [Hymenobacter rigui]|uniref:Uncharacterized protein n=1 Tax=Hymenobacter rigui TaxID=334424 RepID=A0A3R9MNY2_9BACT|nr:hypothetical protein [Hymenobacter rigui]RSK50218.1 hypothetical protein EI291_06075 [Hymenobacter rigui]
MDLTPLFPDLQIISRGLREQSSKLKFSYSETTIRIQAPAYSPENTWHAILVWLGITGIFSIGAFISGAYAFGVITALFGLGSAWHMYWTRNNPPSLEAVRLQNDVIVSMLNQQITVEHLHPYFRQRVSETAVVAFQEVREIRANLIGRSEEMEYGEVYLLLTNNTRLYLAEVETMDTARKIARVLRQVLGLPVEPEPKAWWQF